MVALKLMFNQKNGKPFIINIYKGNAKAFLKTPLENEVEWDKILRSGYATGDLSFTPASLGMKQKEVFSVEADVEAEAFGDSDAVSSILVLSLVNQISVKALTADRPLGYLVKGLGKRILMHVLIN